jgi:hypothetical protein
MLDRSKGRGQIICSPWSSKFGVERGANDSTPEKFTVVKLPETKPDGTQDHAGGHDPHRVVAPVNNNNNNILIFWMSHDSAVDIETRLWAG